MTHLISHVTNRRALIVAAVVALAAALLLSLSLSSNSNAAARKATTATVKIKLQGHHLFFDAPKTVHTGDTLEILNTTSGKQVGPHTFALVDPSDFAKTKPARQHCFTPGHICLSIAKWLGFNGHTITINPGKAGKPGWDTEGSLTKKGDVWFSGGKKGNSFKQVVSAKGGTTLHFMCAIHPFMQGSIKVLP